jgi:hypothetical protein
LFPTVEDAPFPPLPPLALIQAGEVEADLIIFFAQIATIPAPEPPPPPPLPVFTPLVIK